jgi:hypothetical protein
MTVMAWATASNVSTEQVLVQNTFNRCQAGYRGWTAVGLPPGFGGGDSVVTACNVCMNNCVAYVDVCKCVSECQLLTCGNDLPPIVNQLCPG